MADPISACIAIGTNLATSALVAFIKRARIAGRCKSEREKLANKLEAIILDVEDMEHLVEGLRKLKPNSKQTDMRVVERWVLKLTSELHAASVTVDQCSKNVFSSGVNQYSLSKKMTAHVLKIEKLEDQLPNLSVSLQILRNLVTEGRSQVKLPAVFANWVKEKDDILRRADVTRRHEAASCAAQAHSSHCGLAFYTGDPSQHSSPYIYHPGGHGDPAIYTEEAIQYLDPYMNQHSPPFDVSSPQVNPFGSQFPFINHPGSQFPPPPQVNPPGFQLPPSPEVYPLGYQFPPSPHWMNLPGSQFPSSPQMNPSCSPFPFMNHPGPQFPPLPFMNHPAGSQVHPSYNHS